MSSQSDNPQTIPLDQVQEISLKELASFRKFQKRRTQLADSNLVQKVQEGNDLEVIQHIQEELAQTIANLELHIQEREVKGKSTFVENMRKIRALRNLSDLILTKRQTLLNEVINLKSDSFVFVFQELLELFKGSAKQAGVPDFHIDAIIGKLGDNLKGWEERTQRKLLKSK
jgi:hypothetical protein